MRRIAGVALWGLLIACLGAGCARTPPESSDQAATTSAEEPQWVSLGARAFPDEIGKMLYGAGVAEKLRMPDPYVQRKAAEARARLDLGDMLRTLVAAVIKDYAQAAFKPMEKGELQTLTANVQQTVSDAVLDRAEVRERWTNPLNGDAHTLVSLDMDDVIKPLREKTIASEKDRLRLPAAEAHRKLDEIIQKYRRPAP